MPADDQVDFELVRAALDGQVSAFESLVSSCQNRLFHAMVHVTGSLEEAEDVVQEAFVQAYLKLDTFQMNSRFYTWVYRIAFNNALSRKRRKKPAFSLEQSREQTGGEPVSPLDNAEERLIQTEQIAAVQAAIKELSDDHRIILVLRDMQNMSYEDIAEILGMPMGTVRSRLNRARGQLRVLLEKRPEWQND